MWPIKYKQTKQHKIIVVTIAGISYHSGDAQGHSSSPVPFSTNDGNKINHLISPPSHIIILSTNLFEVCNFFIILSNLIIY